MEPGRPLREAFTELLSDETARQAHAADPDGFLEAYGHADLPDRLIAEALVNFADTAPPEVAEHLAPFVMMHSAVPVDAATSVPADPASGLDLLAAAPIDAALAEASAELDEVPAGPPPGHADTPTTDLDFGTGLLWSPEAHVVDTASAPETTTPEGDGSSDLFEIGDDAPVTDLEMAAAFDEPAAAADDSDASNDPGGL